MLRTARYRYGNLFVCSSVRPSVCNVDVLWSHRLEFLKNNCTADWPNLSVRMCQYMVFSTKNMVFSTKIRKIFWGGARIQTLLPVGRRIGLPPLHALPLGACGTSTPPILKSWLRHRLTFFSLVGCSEALEMWWEETLTNRPILYCECRPTAEFSSERSCKIVNIR